MLDAKVFLGFFFCGEDLGFCFLVWWGFLRWEGLEISWAISAFKKIIV